MDRDLIERKDFSVARRGYAPDEVDDHLRQVADRVAALEREQQRTTGLAGGAAEQVREIIDAAERSATQIQRRAEEEGRRAGQEAAAGANRVREEADSYARETRERAQAEAAAYVQRVQDGAERMLERAGAAEAEVERLVEGLRTETSSLVDHVRTSAESVRGDLKQIRDGLPELGAPAAEEPQVDVAGEEEEALPADEAPEEFTTEGVEPTADVEPEAAAPPPTEQIAAEDLEPAEEAEPAGEPEPDEEPEPAAAPKRAIAGSEGARLIALNMALNGTPREETARYLAENFNLDDQDAVLDEVYSRVGS